MVQSGATEFVAWRMMTAPILTPVWPGGAFRSLMPSQKGTIAHLVGLVVQLVIPIFLEIRWRWKSKLRLPSGVRSIWSSGRSPSLVQTCCWFAQRGKGQPNQHCC
jgi:uncharacterized protein YndB with AHSA1/START domain